MSLFGRLLGKTPPRVPAGSKAAVIMNDPYGTSWSVRVDDAKGKKLGPTFTSQAVAYDYAAWCNGEAMEFRYPEEKA